MKCANGNAADDPAGSPSMRREWIEMYLADGKLLTQESLPPCGGSGLKCFCEPESVFRHRSPSMRREWIEISCWDIPQRMTHKSPSMRREWIEIVSRRSRLF